MSDLPRTRTQRVLLLAIAVVGVIAFWKQLSTHVHVDHHHVRHVEVRMVHPAPPAHPLPPMPPPPPPAPPAPPSF